MHHLPRFPTDVPDPQIATSQVEVHFPRIAEAERPDLRPGVGNVDERVIGRDDVRLIAFGVVDVDAHMFVMSWPTSFESGGFGPTPSPVEMYR